MVDVSKDIVKHYFFKFVLNFLADGTCDALVHINVETSRKLAPLGLACRIALNQSDSVIMIVRIIEILKTFLS